MQLRCCLSAVVVERSSRATQGSFWSVGAGSESAEINELTRHQRANIQLLPLRFKDKRDEEEFVFNSSRLMVWRNICLFVFKIISTSCVYGIIAGSRSFGKWSYVPSVFINGLHAIYAALIILAMFSLLLPFIPWIKHRLEFGMYGLLITETVLLAIFVTYEKVVNYSDTTIVQSTWKSDNTPTDDDLCTPNMKQTVFILSMELIMDSWVQFFMYFFIITVSIVLPTRVRIAGLVQAGVLSIYLVPIFAGQAYCRILLYPE